MTSPNYPSHEPDAYPGFTAPEMAAARLAVAAELACAEREAGPVADCTANPVAEALSCYAALLENGCTPEQAQVEAILFGYFDTAGKVIVRQMGGDYSDYPDRFVALAMMEYLNSRMKPETETDRAEVDPADPSTACREQGAE